MKQLGLIMIIFCYSCSQVTDPQQIVDRAIEASGTARLKNSEASFTFRNIQYEYFFSNGIYKFTRIQSDTLGNEVKDILTNDGLIRYINGDTTTITDERKGAYSRSINSVMYFAFLPLWLNDDAVIKEYRGNKQIKDRNYHEVKVTFRQEGGGDHYEDIFLYWFDMEDFSMDYMAYKYYTDGGGIRFREAFNTREIERIAIQDYRNLKPEDSTNIELNDLIEAFENDELELLSIIELKEVTIKLLD